MWNVLLLYDFIPRSVCKQIFAEVLNMKCHWNLSNGASPFHADTQTADETTIYYMLCSSVYNDEPSPTHQWKYITAALVVLYKNMSNSDKTNTTVSPWNNNALLQIQSSHYLSQTATYHNITAAIIQALFKTILRDFITVLITVFYYDCYKIYFHYLVTDTILWWASLQV